MYFQMFMQNRLTKLLVLQRDSIPELTFADPVKIKIGGNSIQTGLQIIEVI